jgi:hypothetical protein
MDGLLAIWREATIVLTARPVFRPRFQYPRDVVFKCLSLPFAMPHCRDLARSSQVNSSPRPVSGSCQTPIRTLSARAKVPGSGGAPWQCGFSLTLQCAQQNSFTDGGPFYRGLRVDRRADFLAEFFTAFMRDAFLWVFLEAGKVFIAFRRRASSIAVGASGRSMFAGAGVNATTFF